MTTPRLTRYLYLILLVFVLPSTSSGSGSSDTLFTFFSGTQASQSVLISFTIRGGVTCQGIQIMRSTDRVNYVQVYEIQGVCGNPTFDESYNWTDESPVPNQYNYYRIDLGSLGLSSDIITVKYIGYNNDGFHMFPNPCSNSCKIYFSNASRSPHQYIIYDSLGKVVATGETDSDEIMVDSNQLTSGIFRFVVYVNSEPRFNGKFVYLE